MRYACGAMSDCVLVWLVKLASGLRGLVGDDSVMVRSLQKRRNTFLGCRSCLGALASKSSSAGSAGPQTLSDDQPFEQRHHCACPIEIKGAPPTGS